MAPGTVSAGHGSGPVAILGAGSVGGSLGERLTECGIHVRFGVRPGNDPTGLLDRCGGRALALAVAEAAEPAEIVFLAVGSEQAEEVVREAGGLGGKIVVDCTNPVAWGGPEGALWDPPPEGSVARALAAAFPEARVVKGFCSFGAAFHRTARVAGMPVDVPLAGDDAEAKQRVAAVARRAGFSPWDAGPLSCAGLLEALAVLWIRRARGGAGRDFVFQPVHDSRRAPTP